MNERIKELADLAAHDTRAIHNNAYWRMQEELAEDITWREKFAELIVRECLSIVENNNPCPPGTIKMYSLDQDEYFDKGWQVAVETKSNQIQKHFGVEE